MKKKLPLILVFLLVLTVIVVAAFLPKDEEPAGTVDVPEIGQPVLITVDPSEETTTKKSDHKSMEDRIEVLLPADFVDAKYKGDLDAFAKAKNYDSVVAEGDKVRVRMREFSYDLLLTQKGMMTVTGIAETIDSKSFPYVMDLSSYNEDFSQIVLSVKSKSMKKAGNLNDLYNLVASYALYYQLYLKDSSMSCEILIIEDKSNILLEKTTITPDSFVS